MSYYGDDNEDNACHRFEWSDWIRGGRDNLCSILEAFMRVETISGKPMRFEYVKQNREGDHICYISDLGKIQIHYPMWSISRSPDEIFEETVHAMKDRL